MYAICNVWYMLCMYDTYAMYDMYAMYNMYAMYDLYDIWYVCYMLCMVYAMYVIHYVWYTLCMHISACSYDMITTQSSCFIPSITVYICFVLPILQKYKNMLYPFAVCLYVFKWTIAIYSNFQKQALPIKYLFWGTSLILHVSVFYYWQSC